MSRTCSVTLVAIAIVCITLSARATVYCASPSGSAANDGTPSSPLTLQTALDRANAGSESATVSLLAGAYCATGGLTIGANVVVQGAGVEQSLVIANLAVHDSCAMENLQVVGTISGAEPDACVLVKNVKLVGQATGISLVGTWLDMENNLHISNIASPPAETEPPNWAFVSNFVAQAIAEAGKKQVGKTATGGIYEYADHGDAAVSNFAIAYTDTQVVELATVIASNVATVSNAVVAAAVEAYAAAVTQTLDAAKSMFVNSAGDVMSGPLGVQGSLTVSGSAGYEQTVTRTATSAVAPNGKWTNTAACFVKDGAYAVCIGGPDHLDVTGWGFSIPSTDQVSKVLVRFTGMVSSGLYGSANYTVLIDGVEISGRMQHYWSNTFDATDDWEIGLTPEELNFATFGVRINSDTGLKLDSVTMSAQYGQPASDGEVVTPVVRLTQPTTARDCAASVAYVDDKVFTGVNIADATIDGTKLADATIEGVKLVDTSIEGTKLADASITADKLDTTSVDQRYLSKASTTPQTIMGELNAPQVNVAGNWIVGAPGNTQRIAVNNNSAGRITAWAAPATTYTVAHNLGIAGGAYAVIITPTSDPNGVYFISAKGNDSFTVTTKGQAFSFDYLIIQK